MSNPMKRRKLHRAAMVAGGEVKETPVAAPVVSEIVEETAKPRGRSRGRFRREGDAQTAEEGAE